MEAVNPGAGGLVGGRYQLLERIGEGNFAVTYQARDVVLGRAVAVKLLRAQHAASPVTVARFEREARVAASVSHPNTVDVYDYGAHEGTFFIAMQLVSGTDLKRHLAERRRLPAPEAVRIGRQILGGLEAIHAAGIIHRDIKPQNVLIGRDGAARVTDFGVAQAAVEEGLTSHGTTVGTAAYMAPEQARGGALSEATDLYAVGVVLYELLTGRLPFEASNPMAVMLAHIQKAPPPPRDLAPDAEVPPDLEDVILQALAKDPAERFRGARAMAAALAQAVPEEPALDPSAPTTRFAAPTASHPRAPIGATVPLGTPGPVGAALAPFDGEAATVAVPAARRPARALAPAPAMLPARRRGRRRVAGWLWPVAVVAVALATLGGVVAANLREGGGGGGGEEDDRRPIAAASPTSAGLGIAIPLVSATATATAVPPSPNAAPSATVPSTQTPVPTAAPPTATTVPPSVTPVPLTPTIPPTATPTSPAATATTRPTATAPPPTATPQLTATRVPPTPVPPTPLPTEPPAPGRRGDVLRFGAGGWDGGVFEGDRAVLGLPATQIFGQGSGASQATLVFDLAEVPEDGVRVVVAGLDDPGTADDVPITIGVNDALSDEPSPFFAWDGTPGANWATASFGVTADVLLVGRNELVVTNQALDGGLGRPPWVALGDVTVTVNTGAPLGQGAAADSVLEAEDPDDTPVPIEPLGRVAGVSEDPPDPVTLSDPPEPAAEEQDAGAPDAASGEPAPAALASLSFASWDWGGAAVPVDSGMYGYAGMALYGFESGRLDFTLDATPTGPATLSILGLDNEDVATNISVAVNGVELHRGPAFVCCWRSWENAPGSWSTLTLGVPAGILAAGPNAIVVTVLDPPMSGPIPYVLVSDTSLQFGGG